MEENKTMVMILTGIGILLWNALRFTNIFLAFPVKAYLIRERDISYKKGWYNFKLTTIPFNRIQHVEIKQSFLQKLMKISTIKIFTAGGSTSDLSIPGLKNEKAQEIKEYLSQNISTHE
jgi:membrane protein YdbS with pleckstrin-like domain